MVLRSAKRKKQALLPASFKCWGWGWGCKSLLNQGVMTGITP
jgi:hypothetical protein